MRLNEMSPAQSLIKVGNEMSPAYALIKALETHRALLPLFKYKLGNL